MLQKIKNLLWHFRRLIYNRVTFANWSRLKYTTAIYEISPTEDGKFCASVHLFLNEPVQGVDAPLNKVLVIPLNIVQSSPEKLITYLYMLGPIFKRTSDKALETNKHGQVIRRWMIIPADEAASILQNLGDVKPTHMGSDAVN